MDREEQRNRIPLTKAELEWAMTDPPTQAELEWAMIDPADIGWDGEKVVITKPSSPIYSPKSPSMEEYQRVYGLKPPTPQVQASIQKMSSIPLEDFDFDSVSLEAAISELNKAISYPDGYKIIERVENGFKAVVNKYKEQICYTVNHNTELLKGYWDALDKAKSRVGADHLRQLKEDSERQRAMATPEGYERNIFGTFDKMDTPSPRKPSPDSPKMTQEEIEAMFAEYDDPSEEEEEEDSDDEDYFEKYGATGNGLGRKLKILELFKGTGSVGKAARRRGMDVRSLDFLEKYKPDILADMLTWDYKKWLEESKWVPDLIWASPPCNTFSPLAYPLKERNTRTATPYSARAKQGTQILYRTLEAIKFFKSKNPNLLFVIENPRGMMRMDAKMKKLPMETTTYCAYGDFKRKPTDFWNNLPNGLTLKPLGPCPNPEKIIRVDRLKTIEERYSIPQRLMTKLLTEMATQYGEKPRNVIGGYLMSAKKGGYWEFDKDGYDEYDKEDFIKGSGIGASAPVAPEPYTMPSLRASIADRALRAEQIARYLRAREDALRQGERQARLRVVEKPKKKEESNPFEDDIEGGMISAEQLERGKQLRQQYKRTLARILNKLGMATIRGTKSYSDLKSRLDSILGIVGDIDRTGSAVVEDYIDTLEQLESEIDGRIEGGGLKGTEALKALKARHPLVEKWNRITSNSTFKIGDLNEVEQAARRDYDITKKAENPNTPATRRKAFQKFVSDPEKAKKLREENRLYFNKKYKQKKEAAKNAPDFLSEDIGDYLDADYNNIDGGAIRSLMKKECFSEKEVQDLLKRMADWVKSEDIEPTQKEIIAKAKKEISALKKKKKVYPSEAQPKSKKYAEEIEAHQQALKENYPTASVGRGLKKGSAEAKAWGEKMRAMRGKTHSHPDGTVMTGATHTSKSKVIESKEPCKMCDNKGCYLCE
jgi:hypothetical protein